MYSYESFCAHPRSNPLPCPLFRNIGSHWECSYALASYGIQKNSLPVNYDGSIQNDWLLSYLQEREQKERTAKALAGNAIISPRCSDVLLGRGRPYQEFPGNAKLAEIIDDHREAYQQPQRKLRKTAISNEVLKIIKLSNGRFLKKHESDEGIWVEVSDEIARDKISHSFRTKSKKAQQLPNPATSNRFQDLDGEESMMSIDTDTEMSVSQAPGKKPRLSTPDIIEEVNSGGA